MVSWILFRYTFRHDNDISESETVEFPPIMYERFALPSMSSMDYVTTFMTN